MLRQCTRTLRSLVVSQSRRVRCQDTSSVASKILATRYLSSAQSSCHILLRSYSTQISDLEGNTESEVTDLEVNTETEVTDLEGNAESEVTDLEVEGKTESEVTELEGTAESEEKSDAVEEIVEEVEVEEPLSELEASRADNIQQQEQEMNTIVIHGLDTATATDEDHLREQVLQLFSTMGIRQTDEITNIRAVGTLILCTFPERKYVNIVLASRRGLRGSPEYSNITVRESMCRPYSEINYHLRMLRKQGRIASNSVYNGTNQVVLLGSDERKMITHMQDLVDLGLLEIVES